MIVLYDYKREINLKEKGTVTIACEHACEKVPARMTQKCGRFHRISAGASYMCIFSVINVFKEKAGL